MSNTPLSRNKHQYAGLAAGDYRFAAENAVVPIVAEEIPQTLATMALGFVHFANENKYQLVAIQSLIPGQNLYIHVDGRWLMGYKPAWYRTHPFKLLPQEESERLILCIDEGSARYHEQAEEGDIPFFNADGSPSQQVEGLMQFLKKLETGRQVTQAAVDRLAQHQLIVPWQIENRIDGNDDKRQPINGLFKVDEQALNALEPSILGELAKTGALALAYGQLLSEHRVPMIAKLYDLRQEALRQMANKKTGDDLDIESLFADNDDNLTF